MKTNSGRPKKLNLLHWLTNLYTVGNQAGAPIRTCELCTSGGPFKNAFPAGQTPKACGKGFDGNNKEV